METTPINPSLPMSSESEIPTTTAPMNTLNPSIPMNTSGQMSSLNTSVPMNTSGQMNLANDNTSSSFPMNTAIPINTLNTTVPLTTAAPVTNEFTSSTTTTSTPITPITYTTTTTSSTYVPQAVPSAVLWGKHLTGRRYSRPLNDNTYALVTGATSGIGLDLARMLVRDNWNIVIVGRNEAKLSETRQHLLSVNPGINVVPLCADLSQINAAELVFQQTCSQNIPVSILINNAGVGDARPFIEQDPASINSMLNLDVTSYVNLSRCFAPQMVQRGYGKILNVGSIASYIPGPHMTVYYASKAFVLSFSEGLAQELKPYNVSVTCLCPGGTRTNWFNASGATNTGLAQPANLMDCDIVAEKGYAGMMNGKGVVIPGFKNNAMVAGSKILPSGFLAKITSKLNRPKSQQDLNTSYSSQPQSYGDYTSSSVSQSNIPSSTIPSASASTMAADINNNNIINETDHTGPTAKPLPAIPVQSEPFTAAK